MRPRLGAALVRMGLKHTPHLRGARPGGVGVLLGKADHKDFNVVTVNLGGNPDSWWKRAVEYWKLFCKMFTYHYNYMRR